jgi:hypothetical protein
MSKHNKQANMKPPGRGKINARCPKQKYMTKAWQKI